MVGFANLVKNNKILHVKQHFLLRLYCLFAFFLANCRHEKVFEHTLRCVLRVYGGGAKR